MSDGWPGCVVLASETIDIGVGDARAPAGTEPWAKRWRVEFYAAVQRLDQYPKSIQSFIDVGEKFKAWALLKNKAGQSFRTFDEFCAAPNPYGLGCEPARIRSALEQIHGKRAVQVMTTAPAHSGPGRPEGSETGKCANGTIKRGSNSAATRIARLKRDFPKIADALAGGEFISVAAAWRAAGLEKPKDPVKEALRWWAKMDAQQRHKFKCEAGLK